MQESKKNLTPELVCKKIIEKTIKKIKNYSKHTFS
jgi:hypothetical protein